MPIMMTLRTSRSVPATYILLVDGAHWAKRAIILIVVVGIEAVGRLVTPAILGVGTGDVTKQKRKEREVGRSGSEFAT
jgi:hypothetical protein